MVVVMGGGSGEGCYYFMISSRIEKGLFWSFSYCSITLLYPFSWEWLLPWLVFLFVCFRIFSLYASKLLLSVSSAWVGLSLLPFLFLSVLTLPFWWFLLVPMCPQFRTRACVGSLCSVPWGSVQCSPRASLGLGQIHSCITNLSLLFLPLLVNPCWLWLFSASALGQAWFCPLPLVGHLFLLALSS